MYNKRKRKTHQNQFQENHQIAIQSKERKENQEERKETKITFLHTIGTSRTENRTTMDDWVVLDDQNLSKGDEEITISCSVDPSDLIIALSSSDEKMSSDDDPDYDPDDDDDEGYISDDYAPSMADDAYEVPVVDPKLERMNRIAHLVFPRLPARTLLRFKSVSPNFNDLISSPFMVHSHFLHPKAISGVFYHQGEDICYLSLDAPSTNLPDPTLSYLPEPVTIMASTHGMLCVRGMNTFKLYVTNPTTKEWVELPAQPTIDNFDKDKISVVIVFDEPSVYNFTGDYRVVCAYPIIEGVFSFMTFSSDKWSWTGSNEICEVERLLALSGTAVGEVAYWRTTFDFILSYDPVKDRANTMQRPHYEMNEVWWELGEMNGQLSVTSQSDLKKVLVSTMTSANNGENPSWKEMAKFWLSGDVDVLPIRSQGLANLVFWEETNKGRGLVLRDSNGRKVCCFEEPAYYYGFFPYISTLVPVRRSGAGTGTGPSSVGNIGSGDEASG